MHIVVVVVPQLSLNFIIQHSNGCITLLLDINNGLLLQWTHPGDYNTATRCLYPIVFPVQVFTVYHSGNFQSTQSGTATYNDLSMYTGYIAPDGLDGYKIRCNSNARCLFIGC